MDFAELRMPTQQANHAVSDPLQAKGFFQHMLLLVVAIISLLQQQKLRMVP